MEDSLVQAIRKKSLLFLVNGLSISIAGASQLMINNTTFGLIGSIVGFGLIISVLYARFSR